MLVHFDQKVHFSMYSNRNSLLFLGGKEVNSLLIIWLKSEIRTKEVATG